MRGAGLEYSNMALNQVESYAFPVTGNRFTVKGFAS